MNNKQKAEMLAEGTFVSELRSAIVARLQNISSSTEPDQLAQRESCYMQIKCVDMAMDEIIRWSNQQRKQERNSG